MAFDAALLYALSSLQQDDIVLKKEQREAIKLLYQSKDVFLWLPTRFGKSLCFQVLPFLFDYKLGRMDSPLPQHSVVVVVSPLVSLMVDQVTSLCLRGMSAAILSGFQGVDHQLQANEKDMVAGLYRLLYCAPEALFLSDKWRRMLACPPLINQIVAVAVDEAHCVYKW